MTRPALTVACLAALPGAAGCLAPPLRPGDELPRRGDEIVVCGRLFHTGAAVVLWTDPDGFDAYRVHRRFAATDELLPSRPAEGCDTPNRYSAVRAVGDAGLAARIASRGWALADLQAVVDQFVIHYDACGASRRCFEVLHDVRGLSVHFLLDVDGTIYQTLDLKERARHAGIANDRSIGIEIAQIGAYPQPEMLNAWYAPSPGQTRLILPDEAAYAQRSGGDRREYVAARPHLVHGTINGTALVQYDFTPEQYRALARLSAALVRIFPKLTLDFPRDVNGCARPDALHPAELAAYRGLLGHWHVIAAKHDPGPAFDWPRLLRETQAQR